MSKDVVSKQSGFNALSSNIVVTMDDVVSAFVSKYETQLFARKKELSAELNRAQEDLRDLTKSVLDKIDVNKHNVPEFSQFNLTAEAKKDGIGLDWEKSRYSVDVVIRHKKNDVTNTNYYGRDNTINVRVYEDLRPADVTDHFSLVKLSESIHTELSDVLDKIKGVARKEREVRGRIAMRKIEESGYSSLLDDGELLQLVQL